MAERSVYSVIKPTPCFDKDGKQIGWFNPRHLATAVFVYAWSRSAQEWCILASIRGEGAESFKGKVNCPCGYMDINITLKENAVKELREECGTLLKPEELMFMEIEDDPSAYGQHVTVRYSAVIKDVNADDFVFSHDENEIDEDGNLEVGTISFIPISKINDFEWAFNHDKVALEYARYHNLAKKSIWAKTKAFFKNFPLFG